jgi:hypothetical protein
MRDAAAVLDPYQEKRFARLELCCARVEDRVRRVWPVGRSQQWIIWMSLEQIGHMPVLSRSRGRFTLRC